MVLLQLLGQGAFIVASLALAAKLLGLWRRTGELPELCVGVAFLLGGGLGYLAWFTLALAAGRGADVGVLGVITLVGLVCTCLGSLANGFGIALVFRPGATWPKPFLALLGLCMAGICVAYFLAPDPETASRLFWAGVLTALPVYVWVAVEASVLARALHKRAKLGLADPVVMNRIAQWGVSGAVIVLMTALSFASRLVHGPVLPAWVAAANAGLGLVAAVAIWVGFFPPKGLRTRLAAAYGT